jgi:hypothetical protein
MRCLRPIYCPKFEIWNLESLSFGRNAQKAVQRNTIRREKKSLRAFFSQLLAFSCKLQAKNTPKNG